MTEGVAAQKAALRQAALAGRSLAAKHGQGQAVAHLQSVLQDHAGQVLAGYMPMRGEIDPLPSMAAHQGPVAVPVIMAKGQPLQFRLWTPQSLMIEGAFKALVPATGDWAVPQILIVPLLAFDRRGYRLGYGGGFYDRTLAQLRATGPVVAVGFAYAAQEVAQVPIEPTDIALDMVVTEQGVIRPVQA